MKRKTTYFLAGVLVVVLLLAMSVTALASDGSFTITIHPIRIMVNGEVFQPKDVNGQDGPLGFPPFTDFIAKLMSLCTPGAKAKVLPMRQEKCSICPRRPCMVR